MKVRISCLALLHILSISVFMTSVCTGLMLNLTLFPANLDQTCNNVNPSNAVTSSSVPIPIAYLGVLCAMGGGIALMKMLRIYVPPIEYVTLSYNASNPTFVFLFMICVMAKLTVQWVMMNFSVKF